MYAYTHLWTFAMFFLVFLSFVIRLFTVKELGDVLLVPLTQFPLKKGQNVISCIVCAKQSNLFLQNPRLNHDLCTWAWLCLECMFHHIQIFIVVIQEHRLRWIMWNSKGNIIVIITNGYRLEYQVDLGHDLCFHGVPFLVFIKSEEITLGVAMFHLGFCHLCSQEHWQMVCNGLLCGLRNDYMQSQWKVSCPTCTSQLTCGFVLFTMPHIFFTLKPVPPSILHHFGDGPSSPELNVHLHCIVWGLLIPECYHLSILKMMVNSSLRTQNQMRNQIQRIHHVC